MRRLICLFLALTLLFCAVTAQAHDTDKIDLDLSAMNDMMRFVMIREIIEKPHNYVGKRIRTVGWYSESKNVKTGEIERMMIAVDFMACCFTDGSIYLPLVTDTPEDFVFPLNEQKFEIVGVVEINGEGMEESILRIESIQLQDHWVKEIYW